MPFNSLGTRRAHLALCLVSALIVLPACSAGYTASQTNSAHHMASSKDDHTLIIGTSSGPQSLDFTRNSGAAIATALMRNVYETLVTVDTHGNLVGALAERWEMTDPTTYLFHLRAGVTFSNGDPFDASSVKFSLDRVRSTEWTNGLKTKQDVIESVTVLDPLTVSVKLSRPSNNWLWDMTSLVGAMMTPSGVDNLPAEAIGTGPYTITRFSPGQYIDYTARTDYWGTTPDFSEATIRYFSDALAATNALKSGDIDVLYPLQEPLLASSFDPEYFTTTLGTTNSEILLSMNNSRAPFTDVRVRQAVMYAIDRQAVIDTSWGGYGVDTGGAPVPPTDPWYEPSTRYPFDPDAARALLAEAGISHEAGNNRVTFVVPSVAYAQTASELIVSQLRDIGLEVTVESCEFPAVWLERVHRDADYDMSLIAHVEARDIPALFGDPTYYLRFDSARVRELLATADSGSPHDYITTMRAAVDEIMEEAAADTLYNFPSIVISRRGITGIDANQIADGLPLAEVVEE